MHNQTPRTALFIALLAVSLLACSVLLSTFLSPASASSGHSTFLSFARGDGELALWRRISAFDRVAFVVIDALRSARVQVIFSFLTNCHLYLKRIFAKQDSSGPWKTIQKLSDTCQGLQFVSVAHTPTVTLPRLKAMMMGA